MCIPNSRYGLTLAWVTSENSTMLLESDILRLFFTGPYLVSSPLCSVSGVDCPSILPRQLLFCCLPLCSPATNSSAPVQLPTASLGLLPPTTFLGLLPSTASPGLQPPTASAPVQLPTASLWSLPLSCPAATASLGLLPPTTNCLSLGRVVNSHSPPRTTSGYGEISCPRILCLVSRQNRQLNRLLWQPTHIVLHL